MSFEARIYDARIGRFLSVDPDYKLYVDLSTYCFAANKPISFIDINGKGVGDPTLPYYSAMSYKKTNITSYPVEASRGEISNTTYNINDGKTTYLVNERVVKRKTVDALGNVHNQISFYFIDSKTIVNDKDFDLGDGASHIPLKGDTWHYWMSSHSMSRQQKLTNEVCKGMGTSVFAAVVAIPAAYGAAATGTLAALNTGGRILWNAGKSSIPIVREALKGYFKASGGERAVSAAEDGGMQYVTNAIDKGWGWDNVSQINLTSIGFSAVLPGSNGIAGFGASGLEFNIKDKYKGLGGGKSFSTFLLQGTINTGGNYLGNKLGLVATKNAGWTGVQGESLNVIANSVSGTTQTIIDKATEEKK